MTRQPGEDFLAKLSAELAAAGIDPRRMAEICAEVEDHLRESARASQLQGRPSDPAWQQSVARFGEPAELARRFATAIEQGDSATTRLASLLALDPMLRGLFSGVPLVLLFAQTGNPSQRSGREAGAVADTAVQSATRPRRGLALLGYI